MPKTKSKRRVPVTATKGKTAYQEAPVPLPPIHIRGQEKVTIDTSALGSVALGKMGKSSMDTRRRINHFHVLIKQCSKLEAQKTACAGLDAQQISAIDQEIDKVSREMAEMGGLDWYQKASLLGQCKQRGGDTSRWLVPKLRELGVDNRQSGPRLRLLDVGALSCMNYAKERKWIDVTPIDLNSQEPGVHQQDFLDIAIGSVLPPSNSDKQAEEDSDDELDLFAAPFDVVCLSLVVNFIGDPSRRGDMLKQASRVLASNGLLFLVLPLSCVCNSRYLDDDRLQQIMRYLGFSQLYKHHTAKLAHYLYRLDNNSGSSQPAQDDAPQFRKKLLFSEPGRNNFSIVV
ncbi:25S rRNA (adenine2142-N1)-methyltransferase [Coemansia sp. RSA 1722]|nr:25S rRNA (adenine2142-N1)-methyltransferase [Coemansia sp. RSA 485]KAJ2595442.1 25S rRNA (adenine2142-N1)-methyltransferase [Coemansia sp. RSA 1722]